MDYAAELRESHVAPHLAEAATSHWMVHELYSTSVCTTLIDGEGLGRGNNGKIGSGLGLAPTV